MRPQHSRLAAFCLCVGVGLSLLGAYAYCTRPGGPALEAAETDIELSDCVPGRKREVVLRLENHSGKPIRVLGVGFC
jgi:hypothetical protein